MTRTLLALFLCTSFGLNAQNMATLDAIVETKRFHAGEQGEQLDVHISVLGGSANWKSNATGERTAHVQAITIIEKDSTIVDFRKSDVFSPAVKDSSSTDFIIDEHFVLPPGEYSLTVELNDLHSTAEDLSKWRGPIVLTPPGNGIHFSDLMFTSGTRVAADGSTRPIPFAGTYFPTENTRLGFYTEIYGCDAALANESNVLVTIQVETYENKLVKGDLKWQQRPKNSSVISIAQEFDIAKLPSGNYLLVVEVMDRNGNSLARLDQFFQRNNPIRYDLNDLSSVSVNNTFVDLITDKDTLAEYIACLRPVCDDLERKMVDDRWKDRDMVLMKRFFYSFWANRDGFDPERAWRAYRQQVSTANRMYGCRNQKGYENDRGVAFLKYGLPSSIVDGSQDNRQLPYIIWHYYRAGRYSDKRLVFWQQTNGIGCWSLLHSEIPGELKNYDWQRQLAVPLGPAGTPENNIGTPEWNRLNDNFQRPH